MAFDANGNLWIASTESGEVTEFTPSQLSAGGTQTPHATISSPDAVGLTFTGAGDLWVSHYEGATTATLTMYPPTQQKTGGTPSVTISSDGQTPPSLTDSVNLAIGPDGDLWVANANTSTLVGFTPTQLTVSGHPVPAVTISAHNSSLKAPYGVTFDSSGDLWASNFEGASLVEYKPTQIAHNGDPTPAVTITGPTHPWQLAFDDAGNLWVAAYTNQKVVEYRSTQLTHSGSPTPSSISGGTTGLADPAALAIKQAPTATSIAPATGPERGGTTVTIHGTGFTSATKVAFGSTAATSVKVISPLTLTAVAPAGLKTVTVTVSTFAGTSSPSAAARFTYVGTGYDLVGSDGGVFVFPVGMPSGFYGSLPGIHVVPNKPVVGMVATTTDTGYFLTAQDGGVFSFGNAPFLGSLPGIHVTPVAPIVGIAAVDTDQGYFLVGQDGGVFTFGPAGTVTFLGSLPGRGIHVDNIIGMAATPSGNGYWLVSSTGTVYTFGAAKSNLGTAKGTSSPVSAIAGTATGGGYWITTQNGALYAFGNAKKLNPGTLPAINVTPAHPVIGIVPTANTTAYWLLGSDGGIFSFSPPGFTLFYGSLPGLGVHVTNIVAAVPN
jgi:sugar lactone lactonase YvrE